MSTDSEAATQTVREGPAGDRPSFVEATDPGVAWKGNPRLLPFLVPIADLQPDPANANTHPERSIASIASSYQAFGQQNLMVCDSSKIVRDGNGRLAAATRLGWTHVAVIPSDLSEIELMRYSLAANQTARHAEWDYEALAGHLKAIQKTGAPIDDLGWADYELSPLLAASWSPPPVGDLPGPDEPGDKPGDADADAGEPLRLTKKQRAVVDRAILNVREHESDPSISEGRCVEMICDRYLTAG